MIGRIAGFRSLWGNARVRILAIATLVGVVTGVIALGQPLDDLFLGTRNLLMQRPASGKIVIVAIDDRTLNELGRTDVSRSMDAKLIDTVLTAGAKRLYFDRSYKFSEDADGDMRLTSALKAWPDKIWFAALLSTKDMYALGVSRLPDEKFMPYVHVASVVFMEHPFSLVTAVRFSAKSSIGVVPSMAASLARLEKLPQGDFIPDYSIDYRTIPTYSYVDVIRGKVDPKVFAGRDVIVSPSALVFNDQHPLMGRGNVPGSYIQAIAAQTLTEGVPLVLGWIPPLIVVMVIMAATIGRRKPINRYHVLGLIGLVVLPPFVFDRMHIYYAVSPAVAASIFAILRAKALERVEAAREINAFSGLPSLQVLRANERSESEILVALKIRNYSGIIGSFANSVERQFAQELVRRIRISETDVTVYHEGGMFVWFSTISNPVDLCENLEGLHRIVQNGITAGGVDIDVAFNSGIDAEIDRSVSSRLATAMQAAEEAVRGDELACIHESGKHEAQWEISLLTSLDRAIDNGEVWVAYQPKLDVVSNSITGVEALVRWTHPERGPISPEKFVKIAEEYHRIERITRFVINDAVRSLVALRRLGHDLTMSVNVSAQLLRNPGLPGMIAEILAAHRLEPERLILEITETDRLERSSRTFQMLHELVDSGLNLSIDDFGTGNATIEYLRYLPASEVKIDKTFVMAMETSREDYLLVQSIVEMAHSLDRRVVAEGVETRTTLDLLAHMGCDMIQGYHLSAAVPYRDLVALIATREERATG